MKAILDRYRNIERHIWLIIIAELFVQLTNSSFFLLLNYYMLKEGYADYTIAKFVKVRFLAVMLLAFPIGLFIKGRKLQPIFTIGMIAVPLMSFLIIYAIKAQAHQLLYIGMMLWGVSFSLVRITLLPYVVLNAKPETHSEVFALTFQTWSIGTIVVGISTYLLSNFASFPFDERSLLLMFAGIGMVGGFFVLSIRKKEVLSEKIHILDTWNAYDWGLIRMVVTPTLIIAVGAGFTIPFINLFFESVHNIDSAEFSLMGSATYILVSFGVFFIPAIKRRFGYHIAITLFQSLAVFALIMMATTEWYKHLPIAIGIAVFFYIMRQPLMNIAGPMTSELTLYYVGKKNRELVAALNASIWSGSWFFSASLFQVFRQMEISYSSIFLITASLYIVGISWYFVLIQKYNKRKKDGLIEFDG
ncbi:MAG: MFS transporter [Chitinophagales bacterium]|nr:MFS transporter [Chitinophagales bacterium]